MNALNLQITGVLVVIFALGQIGLIFAMMERRKRYKSSQDEAAQYRTALDQFVSEIVLRELHKTAELSRR